MIYCKKCVRLLETDVLFCPYCGQPDNNGENPVAEENLAGAEEDISGEEQSGIDGFGKFSDVPVSNGNVFADETVPYNTAGLDVTEKLRAIDGQIAQNEENARVSTEYAVTSLPPQNTKPAGIETVRTYGAGSGPVTEDAPGGAMFITMILLSLFCGFFGIIIGIIYLTNKNANYRKLGMIMLIISLCVSVFGGLGCCAVSSMNSLSEFRYM